MNRILIVDDEPNLLAALKRLIKSLGIECECVFAANGVEGIEQARATSPDVIVTDIRMPTKSGLEMLQALKSDPTTSQIPVIVLTGHGDTVAKQQALELGAHDFINKPAVPAEFAARLRSLFKLKEYEDQLRERNEMLERQVMQLQKMENIGFLAAGFSHDLRNILAAIVGQIDLAASETGVPDSARQRLKTAADAGLQAAELSSNLLNMSKPAIDGSAICDLTILVTQCLNLLAVSIRPDIEVRWSDPGAGMCLMGNPAQIHQVLMNLFINAVHAMPKSGTLSIRVNRRPMVPQNGNTKPPKDSICLEVADTGVGMDDATVRHIFEPFFTTRAEGKGTGLGLSVVQRIVNEHNGTIAVESRFGEGTTFFVCFPAVGYSIGIATDIKGETRGVAETADTVR